ncbi:MAG: FMN-binding protein [Deltaproteobacteria bacterium]|nr:FMN-binding protein [Deltaproteobacteria bacterium]
MREKILIVVVLFAVSAVSALMLAAVNAASRDIIIKNRERNFKMALLSVLELEKTERELEEIYRERIKEQKLSAGKVYFFMGGKDNNVIKGAAFKLTGSGFWGPISVMVGVSIPGLKITGIEILEQGETPGLGARIEERHFREQFLSKSLNEVILIKVRGEKPGPNDVSAITGATITSKSLEKIINEASRPYIDSLREINHG